MEAARPVRQVDQRPACRTWRAASTTWRSSTRWSSKSNVHGPATFMQNTGFVLPGFPSMGAWVSYGLGSLNENLPTFVVLPDSRGFAPNGPANWSAGFLPAAHQGTMVRAGDREPDLRPVPAAERATSRARARRDGLALLQQLNREHQATRAGRLAARRPHRRPTSWPPACSSAPRRCSTSRGETDGDAAAVRPRRADHRGLRPQLPDRPAAAGARRALRAGLERGRQRLPAPQLGLARGPRPRPRRHGHEHGPARRRPAQGPEGARPARRHDRPLDDRVRPHAVQPGNARAATTIPSPSRPGWPAAASRAASRTARATSGRTRPSTSPPTATTSTPRCCTCWASTTRG